jgi:predicted amidohydrolase YtcJ
MRLARSRAARPVLGLTLLAHGLAACASSAVPSSSAPDTDAPLPAADRVWRGGVVVTGEPGAAPVDAIAVRDGKIVALGADAVARHLAPSTEVLELDGRVVLPGLVDAHAHLAGLGDALVSIDLRGTRSYRDVLTKVGEAHARQPDGWLVGRGWDQNEWPDKRFPDGSALETVAPGRAVWLQRIDGHAGLASAAAMRSAAITRDTADPDGGKIVRREDGEPSGVLVDNAMALVDQKVPLPTAAEQHKRLERAMHTALRVGITEVHDMGVTSATLAIYRALERDGKLPLRVYVVMSGDDPAIAEIYRAGPRSGERLTIRAVKFFVDGALGSRGAALLAPYSDDPSNRGLLVTDRATLEAKVAAAVAAGFQPCIHAIGDRGNRIVLDVYRKHARAALRPRIEHAQVLAPEDIGRFARENVIASMQPTHATSDMPWAGERLGEQRLRGAYAWRSLLDTGATLAFGSDFPVERPHILEGIYAAVARSDRQGQPAGGWHPSERLDFAQALAGFTRGAAYAGFHEQRRGVLRVGFDADMTVLSADVARIARGESAPPADLLGAEVEMTVVAGDVVHRRTAH